MTRRSDAPGWNALVADWQALVEYYPAGIPWRRLRGLILRHGGKPERITTNCGVGSIQYYDENGRPNRWANVASMTGLTLYVDGEAVEAISPEEVSR